MAVGLFTARRQPGYGPGYRVPGYPVVPALFAAVSAAIAVAQLVSDAREALLGMLLVGVGLPVYYLGRQVAPDSSSTNTRGSPSRVEGSERQRIEGKPGSTPGSGVSTK